jgi:hypothetical protein
VKSDCAKGLCAAVFIALTLSGPVATRITYNNLMLMVLCHCGCSSWMASEVNPILGHLLLVITIIIDEIVSFINDYSNI